MEQQYQVGAHAQADDQPLQPGASGVVQDQLADYVVERNGPRQKRHELRVPPAVEDQRGQAQPQRRQAHVQRPQRVIDGESDRQEDQQEQVGVK
ncbi:hypothetical protein G6F31_021151 [Rhizopus arrhizus]|nr:hypothetical protein G6F31_021151 [Rhizopus arrhizus]